MQPVFMRLFAVGWCVLFGFCSCQHTEFWTSRRKWSHHIYIYIYDYTRSLLMPVFLFCCSFLPIFMVDSKCHLLSWMKQNTTLWPTFTQSQRNPAQIKITCDTFYFVITTVRLRAHMPRAFRLNCLYSPIYILKRLLSKYWLKLEHSHYSY